MRIDDRLQFAAAFVAPHGAQIFTVDDLRYLRRTTGRLSISRKPPPGPCCRSSLLKGDPAQGASIVCFATPQPPARHRSAIMPERYEDSWSETDAQTQAVGTAHADCALSTRRSSPRCCARSSCPPKQILLVDYEPW